MILELPVTFLTEQIGYFLYFINFETFIKIFLVFTQRKQVKCIFLDYI